MAAVSLGGGGAIQACPMWSGPAHKLMVCCAVLLPMRRYTGPDFQEGVSLNYMDEVIKFKKFAYVSLCRVPTTLMGVIRTRHSLSDAAAAACLCGLQALPRHALTHSWLTTAHRAAGSEGWNSTGNHPDRLGRLLHSAMQAHVHVPRGPEHDVVCGAAVQGACEMLFNPFGQWLTKGPFNKLFVNYIWNKHIKWYQKVRAWLAWHDSRHTVVSWWSASTTHAHTHSLPHCDPHPLNVVGFQPPVWRSGCECCVGWTPHGVSTPLASTIQGVIVLLV